MEISRLSSFTHLTTVRGVAMIYYWGTYGTFSNANRANRVFLSVVALSHFTLQCRPIVFSDWGPIRPHPGPRGYTPVLPTPANSESKKQVKSSQVAFNITSVSRTSVTICKEEYRRI